jgi:hypothetical protein
MKENGCIGKWLCWKIILHVLDSVVLDDGCIRSGFGMNLEMQEE